MPVGPALTGFSVLAASAAWSILLVANGTRMGTAAAALLGLDVVVLAGVVVAGLLIGRSRWARRSAVLLVGFQLVMVPALPADGWRLAVAVLCAAALVAVAGPWLRGWVRRLPNATGPPASAVILMLGLIALPGVAALANPTGAAWGSWALAIGAVAAAWACGRGLVPGLWATRVGLVPAAVPAVVQSTVVGGAIVAAAVLALVGLSWSREVGLAVRPLQPPRRPSYPIPPGAGAARGAAAGRLRREGPPLAASMSRMPRPLFLVPLVAAGVFGAITGRTVARVSCVVGDGPPGSGCPGAEIVAAVAGALVAMVGVAVVAALALLSLAEWRQTRAWADAGPENGGDGQGDGRNGAAGGDGAV